MPAKTRVALRFCARSRVCGISQSGRNAAMAPMNKFDIVYSQIWHYLICMPWQLMNNLGYHLRVALTREGLRAIHQEGKPVKSRDEKFFTARCAKPSFRKNCIYVCQTLHWATILSTDEQYSTWAEFWTSVIICCCSLSACEQKVRLR